MDPGKFPQALCDFVAQCLRRDDTKPGAPKRPQKRRHPNLTRLPFALFEVASCYLLGGFSFGRNNQVPGIETFEGVPRRPTSGVEPDAAAAFLFCFFVIYLR